MTKVARAMARSMEGSRGKARAMARSRICTLCNAIYRMCRFLDGMEYTYILYNTVVKDTCIHLAPILHRKTVVCRRD